MNRLMLPLLLGTLLGPSAVAQTTPPPSVINSKELTAAQRAEFVQIYGTQPLGGNFWYDARSGLWGVVAREASG